MYLGWNCYTKEQQQSHCSLWHKSHYMQFTSSVIKRIPLRASMKPSNTVKDTLHSSFRENQATEHGRRSESRASSKFMIIFNCLVQQMGLVVYPEMPWLAKALMASLMDLMHNARALRHPLFFAPPSKPRCTPGIRGCDTRDNSRCSQFHEESRPSDTVLQP